MLLKALQGCGLTRTAGCRSRASGAVAVGAGVRTCDLIRGCQRWGWDVAYLSPAACNEHTALLEEVGVRIVSCQMNRLAHALPHAARLARPSWYQRVITCRRPHGSAINRSSITSR